MVLLFPLSWIAFLSKFLFLIVPLLVIVELTPTIIVPLFPLLVISPPELFVIVVPESLSETIIALLADAELVEII